MRYPNYIFWEPPLVVAASCFPPRYMLSAVLLGQRQLSSLSHAPASFRFWTVTGDKVASMTMVDANGDGQRKLLVGSDDFEVLAEGPRQHQYSSIRTYPKLSVACCRGVREL